MISLKYQSRLLKTDLQSLILPLAQTHFIVIAIWDGSQNGLREIISNLELQSALDLDHRKKNYFWQVRQTNSVAQVSKLVTKNEDFFNFCLKNSDIKLISSFWFYRNKQDQLDKKYSPNATSVTTILVVMELLACLYQTEITNVFVLQGTMERIVTQWSTHATVILARMGLHVKF